MGNSKKENILRKVIGPLKKDGYFGLWIRCVKLQWMQYDLPEVNVGISL